MLGCGPGEIEIRRAAVEEILLLRYEVLILGTDRTSAEFPGDRESGTRHYAAFDIHQVVGCATFMLSQWENEPAWQLRGMATAPGRRGQGIGSALLILAEGDLWTTSEIHQLWCNARIGAVTFYDKHGWTLASDEFMIPGVGPHRKMAKRLSASPRP